MTDRLRRTRLYVPGNNPSMVQNASVFGADSIILDLEDSIPVSEKDAARILVRNALQFLDFSNTEVTVRVNDSSTPFLGDDLFEIIPAKPDAIIIPKVESLKELKKLDIQVTIIEKENDMEVGSIKFMPIIETAIGVVNIEEIASGPRVTVISPGGEDLTADLGIERTKEGAELSYIQSRMVVAAAAAKIQIIDTVFVAVNDIDGLIQSTKKAISMGFHGKSCIHPIQIKPIHEAFLPSPEKIAQAKKIVEAYEKATRDGTGAITVDGRMIDVPVVIRSQRLLERARAGGVDV